MERTAIAVLDTSFLVDLERETRRRIAGPATRYLRASTGAVLAITPHVAGELACGGSLRTRGDWSEFVSHFDLLPTDEDVLWTYATISRDLRSRGTPIGVNDQWIAATALVHGAPVVTANAREFSRVEGLEVVAHRERFPA